MINHKGENMKKSIAILLALLMMAGTLGCSSENVQEKETAQSDTTSSVGETEAQESETEEETEASVFAGIEEKNSTAETSTSFTERLRNTSSTPKNTPETQ